MIAITDPADLRRQRLLGMGCAVAASAAFSVNDVAIKFLSGDYALHQVILTRSLIGMTLLFTVLLPFNGGFTALRTAQPGKHALRGASVVLSNICYFMGLAALTLTDTVTIFFVAPLMVTALSVPLLGERVGPRRWAAVLVGLIGVAVMMRPGQGVFTWAFVLPVLSALAYACMHIMTRRMGGRESAVTMTFYVQLSFVLFSLTMGLLLGDGRYAGRTDPSLAFLTRPWVWPPGDDWLVMAATGFGSAIGGVLIAQAYKLCEASLAAPFEYVAIPLSIAWGYLVFNDWPDGTAFLGIALICSAGLYTVWREAIRGARQAPKGQMP
jgi:drug/metabolite transporter (DMT)-like permease